MGQPPEQMRNLNNAAIIVWPWKLIVGTPGRIIPQDYYGYWGIENYTFIPGPPEDKNVQYRLFNIQEDERELLNLASAYPDKVHALTERLEWWADPANGYRSAQPNFPNPRGNPAYFDWTVVPFLPEDVPN